MVGSERGDGYNSNVSPGRPPLAKPLLAQLAVAVEVRPVNSQGGGTFVTRVARETNDDN